MAVLDVSWFLYGSLSTEASSGTYTVAAGGGSCRDFVHCDQIEFFARRFWFSDKLAAVLVDVSTLD